MLSAILNDSVRETCANMNISSAVEHGNTVGMLKMEAERTRENVRCQAEVENEPDKLTNY